MNSENPSNTIRKNTPHRLKFLALFLISLATFILTPSEEAGSSVAPVSEIITDAALPPNTTPQTRKNYHVALVEHAADNNPIAKITDTVKTETYVIENGDSFSQIMAKRGHSPQSTLLIASLNDQHKYFSKLKPGQTIEFVEAQDGSLAKLNYHRNHFKTTHLQKEGDGQYSITESTKVPIKHTQIATGRINSSLFIAGINAGLSDNIIMKLADVFTWDIDFTHDLRPGDQFSVIYETLYIDGQKVRDGDILAAEFINKGKTHRALAFREKEVTSYFTPEGRNLKKSFVRNPVSISRISSGFNLKRKHPVLNTIRAHRGVDYAAPRGTPIKATGDGRIEFVGTKGGYGRTVVITHAGKYSTLYAHMKSYAKNAKRGKYVKQGQIIGYIGSSGLATGPHLHYEFRVNGTHRNPLTVALPRAAPLQREKQQSFHNQTGNLVAQLNTLGRTDIASARFID